MRVLCVGDVFGSVGCEAVKKFLPSLKTKLGVDLTIINGENSADGNGITPDSANTLLNYGADILTGGNHTLRRKEFYEMLDSNPFMLRPENIDVDYGSGYCLYDMGRFYIAVINLIGVININSGDNIIQNPFATADNLLQKARHDGAKIIIVDFHAEATSEKRALGFYLDSKISAVFGTHTHVQTADEQILSGGTGYITDIGMTGVVNSVLGVEKDIIISRLKDSNMQRFLPAKGESMLNGCLFDIDENTGKTTAIQRIYLK